MAETMTIEKSPALETSQDYAALRKAGISHLQSLGGQLWTDYNLHDPGVMILEMLSYAITDLGYRTAYDIQDILSLKKGDPYFHTARNILTINPTTVNDYRKLLMDIEGVKNAWLSPTDTVVEVPGEDPKKTKLPNTNEIPIYLDAKEGELTYGPVPLNDEKSSRILLRGLYNVRLEFEEDDEYGDLNDPVIKRSVTVDGNKEVIEFTFPTWQELLQNKKLDLAMLRTFLDRGRIKVLDENLPSDLESNKAIVVTDIKFDEEEKGYRFTIDIHFEYQIAATPPDPGFNCGPGGVDCNTDLPVKDFHGLPAIPPAYPTTPHLTAVLARGTISGIEVLVRYPGRADKFEELASDLLEDNEDGRLVEFYRQKIDFTLDIVDHVWCKLHSHRNLCEDFLAIDSLKTEEIAVCAEVEIKPDAHVNKVMADIMYQIDTFISPPVNFFTIQQLLDQGLTTDQIFNGPALDHGFIKDDELDRAILKKVIHTSDLINIIMDVEGVLAVRSLQVANYIDGLPLTTGTSWTLELKGDGLHVPKLSEEKSKILFFKDLLPFRANLDEVAEFVAELRVRNYKGRLKETKLDIDLPEGVDREPGVYTTIQNQFPISFGTTQHGIPGNITELRKAQAKQLKTYLLFFEQLLANYLAQLSHVKDLFSMGHDAPDESYFTQVIQDPKDIEDLYVQYNSTDKFDKVAQALRDIAESEELYEDRKNRFLDHLSARFAESFGEYALLMYALRNEKAGKELIEDKLQFLADYPAISGDRGKAFNYRPMRDCKYDFPHALWNTKNVAGLKKRVARLLGMENYHRRNLAGHMFELYENVYTQRPNTWVWKLHDITDPAPLLKDKRVLLRSLEYETKEEANYMVTYAIAMVEMQKLVLDTKKEIDRSCCNRVGIDDLLSNPPAPDPVLGFILNNVCDEVIACSPPYTDVEKAKADMGLVADYVIEFCDQENFHLIEHILLRPRYDGTGTLKTPDHLLPICAEPLPDSAAGQLKPIYYLDINDRWRFRVLAKDGFVGLRSQASFETQLAIMEEFSIMNGLRRDDKSFERRQTKTKRHYFALVDSKGEVRATSHAYKTKEELETAIRLLSGGKICSEFVDPYSFRVSVVLPSWAGRFRDINYRRMVEKTLRLEAPAHVFLRICWIDRDQMADFECLYRCWLLELGKTNGSPEAVSPKLNAFVDKLFALENIYPLATLHSCDDDSGNDAQVVLNYTSLGTL